MDDESSSMHLPTIACDPLDKWSMFAWTLTKILIDSHPSLYLSRWYFHNASWIGVFPSESRASLFAPLVSKAWTHSCSSYLAAICNAVLPFELTSSSEEKQDFPLGRAFLCSEGAVHRHFLSVAIFHENH